MSETIIIAGAGHAGGQTAISLRQAGFAARLIIVGDEPWLPYQRPPLSKKFLAGELPLERLLLRQESYYADHDIEMRLGTRIESIDRAARQVRLGNGESLDYALLVIATGSHVRRMGAPGETLAGVHYLRSVNDVLGIREDFMPGARLVIVGAGYIGLEVAAVATTLGLEVTVLEVMDRVMSRVVAPPVSEFFEAVHRAFGVDVRCGASPTQRFLGTDRVTAVELENGETIPADLVLIGIGILPAIDLAEAAGLACDNGILVDEFCRTNDPLILAVGDCTNHPNALLGRRLRLESVHNAQEQAKTAAAVLCGQGQAYAQVPWFWSDQYDLKLQTVGLSQDYDQIVMRGEPAQKCFAAFYLRDGRLIAVDAINSPREFMLSKKLIAAAARPDAGALGDPAQPFKEIAAAALS